MGGPGRGPLGRTLEDLMGGFNKFLSGAKLTGIWQIWGLINQCKATKQGLTKFRDGVMSVRWYNRPLVSWQNQKYGPICKAQSVLLTSCLW